MTEQDQHAGELDEPKKILSVRLPSDEESAVPLHPSKESFHQLSPFVATKPQAIVRGALLVVRVRWSDHVEALLV